MVTKIVLAVMSGATLIVACLAGINHYLGLRDDLRDALDNVAVQEQALKNSASALAAAESAATRRIEANNGLRDDEREIYETPTTTACVNSPAVRTALDQLRNLQAARRAAADDTE